MLMKKLTSFLLFIFAINSIFIINNELVCAKEIKFKGFFINMPLDEAITIVKANYKYSNLEVTKINGLCSVSLDSYGFFNLAMFKYDNRKQIKYILLDRKIVNELFNVNDMSPKEFNKMFVKAYNLPLPSHFDGFYEYVSSDRYRLSIIDKEILLEEIPSQFERKFD
jgi:hypothetical protein